MIGYIKKFPSIFISGWAIGTGIGCPLGGLIYLFHRFIRSPYYLVII